MTRMRDKFYNAQLLFDATGNFNHQILPYGILFLTFINTNVFYLLLFKISCLLVKTMAFSFKLHKIIMNGVLRIYILIFDMIHFPHEKLCKS
jgi:hypothetical protein